MSLTLGVDGNINTAGYSFLGSFLFYSQLGFSVGDAFLGASTNLYQTALNWLQALLSTWGQSALDAGVWLPRIGDPDGISHDFCVGHPLWGSADQPPVVKAMNPLALPPGGTQATISATASDDHGVIDVTAVAVLPGFAPLDPESPPDTWRIPGGSRIVELTDPDDDGVFEGDVVVWHIGTYSVLVMASDGAGHTASDSTSITVQASSENDPPTVSDIPDVTLAMGGSREVPLDEYVADPDDSDDQLTWTVSGYSALDARIDPGTRVLRVSAPAGWWGSERLHLTATDPGGLSGSDH
ncbi:MAG: hypothetical protein GTN93_07610, partial [Anaerolineae bacterium]|nr:hypothetical protein [Anaerolineae bacterium]